MLYTMYCQEMVLAEIQATEILLFLSFFGPCKFKAPAQSLLQRIHKRPVILVHSILTCLFWGCRGKVPSDAVNSLLTKRHEGFWIYGWPWVKYPQMRMIPPEPSRKVVAPWAAAPTRFACERSFAQRSSDLAQTLEGRCPQHSYFVECIDCPHKIERLWRHHVCGVAFSIQPVAPPGRRNLLTKP